MVKSTPGVEQDLTWDTRRKIGSRCNRGWSNLRIKRLSMSPVATVIQLVSLRWDVWLQEISLKRFL